ncbi:outer envelope pore protein 37, chloroplastic-like [Hibiscus syriacus]|uniref:outer envelope pore protein 37, chloroplastic-like n=1 Tax=Hibiscus syriacus TaxID=106335 RepID=UPI001922BFC2|nr:outer envelope pore protein 37, chloroplastic-like [Hibiscus syriacus]
MLESSSQPPNYLISPTTPPPSPPPAPPPIKPNQFFSLISSRPSLRVTSEFDSDSRFFQKVKRQISEPLLALTSKHLSIHKDPQEQNALIKSSFDVGPKLHFKVAHDVKPKATIRFLTGEVTLEEKEEEEEEVSRKLLINGILKGPILNGVGAAHYTDKELKLRYSYKVIFSSALQATVSCMGVPMAYFLLNNLDGSFQHYGCPIFRLLMFPFRSGFDGL